jgi:hypothetical protein
MNDTSQSAVNQIGELLSLWVERSATWDPTERVSEGKALMDYLREHSVRVPAEVRRGAVREMLGGMSIREAARELGLAPSRIVQIRDGR